MAVTLRTRLRWAAAILLRGTEPRPQPWDYVQSLVETRLHEYLCVHPGEVESFVIVGAYRGHELRRLLRQYPRARFVCFEPAPAEFAVLASSYGREERVQVIDAAASDESGEATFWLADRGGTSSLLRPTGAATAAVVRTTRLDDEAAVRRIPDLDCLWLDVQGAEDRVLAGAPLLLDRTSAVFAEVATRGSSYERGCDARHLAAMLEPRGFVLEALGLDPRNGEGNSLWIRR